MAFAKLLAQHSKAERKQVGAVIVTSNGVVLTGYNGTPSGTENSCEDSNGITKIEVLHAELNCILKAAKEGVSVIGSSLYVTLSPCKQCSAMIIQSGIKRVVYLEDYRDVSGIEYLRQHGIDVSKLYLN
jgi:dCMP deaminase